MNQYFDYINDLKTDDTEATETEKNIVNNIFATSSAINVKLITALSILFVILNLKPFTDLMRKLGVNNDILIMGIRLSIFVIGYYLVSMYS